jgi:serine/threonine-protein kinase
VFVSRVPQALRSLQSYTVLRPLGNGGMSSVYLARARGGDQLCVLKTLASVDAQLAPAEHAEASLCLQREAALLGQLDHPRVAHVLDWLSDSQGDFLVLDYIAGPTLEQRLTRLSAQGQLLPGDALPPAEALAYGAAVAETLCYLAALPQPVIHCDIKPANLILPPGSRAPVLVDFGGAVRAQAGPQPTVLLGRYGTPGYAAPEQYAGSSSPKSDVYGLAATLYHLLTDDDPSAHPLAFPALATLPAELAGALALALEPDPTSRPDAWEFGAQLRRLGA